MRRAFRVLLPALAALLAWQVVPDADSRDPRYPWFGWDLDPAAARARAALFLTGDTLTAYRDAWEVATIAERVAALPPMRDSLEVIADAGVPADQRLALRDQLRRELAEIGGTRVPIRALILRDSSARWWQLHRVRPVAAGEPCTIVTWVRAQDAGGTGPRRVRRLGVCGFYARHGMPGPAMAAWLDSTGARAARADTTLPERTPRAPQAYHGGMVADEPALVACASGRRDACAAALLDPPAPRRRPAVPLAPSLPGLSQGNTGLGYEYPSDVLARLREAMGPERFSLLWRDARPIDEAYAAIVGEPFAEFAQAYVRREVAPHPRGPLRAGLPLALSLALIVGAAWLAITITPRARS